jgi:hypothetical protein
VLSGRVTCSDSTPARTMNAVSPPSKESASACPLRVSRLVAWEAIAAGTDASFVSSRWMP